MLSRKVRGSLSERPQKNLKRRLHFQKKKNTRLSVFSHHKIAAPITLSPTSKFISLHKDRILQSRNRETIDVLLVDIILNIMEEFKED